MTTAATSSPTATVPTAGLRFWVVPHTHWDREWYATADDLRLRLVDTMDELLATLEADERMEFTLDGQSVIVEDYLAVRPEQAARLRALLATRRLVMGPFYAIGDEHLVTGESLLRNLLLGVRECRALDTEPMRLGYLPDTFGHVSQLPQLLRGFGIDAFVFTRGLGARGPAIGGVLRWQGVDGSELLAVQQPGGYSAANRIGHLLDDREPDEAVPPGRLAAEQVRRIVQRHAPLWEQVQVRDVLLSSGVDHGQVQPDLPDVLAAAAAELDGAQFEVATYERYVEHLRGTLAGREQELPVVRGELPGGLDSDRLQDVDSARMYLKQANERTERELLVAETVAAAAWWSDRPRAAGRAGTWRYPAEELGWAWRELLKNHAHDSIWGSSTDEVHDDMAQRFRTARHVARRVVRNAAAHLSGERDRYDYQPLTGALPRLPAARARLGLFNPLPVERTVTATLRVPAALRDETALAVIAGGRTTLAQLVPEPRTPARTFAADAADPDFHRHVDLAATPHEPLVAARVHLPALAAADVELVAAPPDCTSPADAARVVDDRTIGNGLITAHVAADGTLTLTDHVAGEQLAGLLALESHSDRGDEYTFDPLPGESALWQSTDTAAVVEVLERGPVRCTLEVLHAAELSAGLTPDRAARVADTARLVLCTKISVEAGSRSVRCATVVHNEVRDHRLSVRFPIGRAVDTVRAEGAFCVEHRAAPAPDASTADMREVHVTTGGVAAGPFVLLPRGLPDYEPLPATTGDGADTIALTLLRCVGWLSRPDLARRPGGAGPTYPTPGAQCIGEHEFEYELLLDPDMGDATLAGLALAARTGCVEVAAGAATTPPLEVHAGEHLVFSSLKQSEDGDGLVLRLWNAAGQPQALRVASARPAEAVECRPDERPTGEPAPLPASFNVPPHGIATILVRPRT